ncbi:hypothetical protein [Acinetobacter baumannii]
MTFNEWLGTRGDMVLLHANCCRIAYEGGQQSMQAKVEELEKKLQSAKESAYKAGFYDGRNGTPCEYTRLEAERNELQTLYTQQGINMLKLQKRVDAAIRLIESWNEIAFDKTTHWAEGYEEGCYHCAAQLEQALKGEG